MLLSLNLKNFAIIDDLSIDFGKGLNIITGETGAGKSIIVDAINIILGDRASADLIKSGQEEAQVEALFDISDNKRLRDKLESFGIEVEDDQLLIRRILSRRGKGRVFIGGNIATYSMLEQLTEGIVDVFSQHEHQTLLKEDKHLQLLDEFGGLRVLTEEFGEVYRTYIRLKKELEECESNRRTRVEREDFLRFPAASLSAKYLSADEGAAHPPRGWRKPRQGDLLGSCGRGRSDRGEATSALSVRGDARNDLRLATGCDAWHPVDGPTRCRFPTC